MYSNRLTPSLAGMPSLFSAAVLASVILMFAQSLAPAQTSLGPNVLVVYNSADADSTDVANYYRTKRAIPAANLCPITPPNTTYLAWNDFAATVKGPVRDCLTAVGSGNILYIVFTYNTPYKVVGPDNASYAQDQYIADVWDVYTPAGQYGLPPSPHPYYADAQSQGNVYVPFQSLAAFRNQTSIPIYAVWRLDAATPALAKGLVDKALQAENTGLTGQACIDEQLAASTYDYPISGAADWDLRQAARFALEAGFPVTQDFNSAEFGTSPAPLRCDNAALYSGLYSFNHYNDAFSWNPGAIGFHLESASAYNPRGGTNWSANALIHGVTITSGAVSDPLSDGLPHPDGVFRNLFEGSNIGDALMRNTRWIKWMIMNMGDPLYRPTPAGFPAVTVPENSLALNPRTLVGGNPSTGTITLAAPAGGDTTVSLKTSQTTVATVQPSIIIPAGQTTASFPITSKLVNNDSPVYITATFGTSTLNNTLVAQPLLSSISVSPTSVIGGAAVSGYIFLNSSAPAGGIVVSLSSNNSAVTVPATVGVSEGASGAQFIITTSGVPATTVVTITASYAGAKKISTLSLNPLIFSLVLSPTSVIASGSTTLNKITLNGTAPQDVVVNLTSSDPSVTPPASVTVAAFTTASPLFTIATAPVAATTIVTITGMYNGTTKSANLTVTPITVSSVTLSPSSVVGGVSTTANKVTLSNPAPAGGAVVTLASSDPGVGVPASVTVAAGATVSPTFTITTSALTATKVVTISATYNGLKSANLTVTPIALVSVTVSPTSVVGGVSATVNKVTINAPAPAGGVTVNLTSNSPSAVVPPSVTVSAGATISPYFTITTSAVANTVTATISANYNGVTVTGTLTVAPLALTAVALSPAIVAGGASTSSNKVTLSGAAPAAGAVVNLSSSDPGVTLPATVTVAAGATSSPVFTIKTSTVNAPITVIISGTYNGVTKSANLTVNPVGLYSVALSPTSVVGGSSTSFNKIILNAPAPVGGAVVNLSAGPGVTVPATVTVAAGATTSPAFTIATSTVTATTIVPISATYNGGTVSANLTVNPF